MQKTAPQTRLKQTHLLCILALSFVLGVADAAAASTLGAGFDLDPVIIGSSNPYPPRGQVQSVAVRNGKNICREQEPSFAAPE